MDTINFLQQHYSELWLKVAEQIYLVGISVAAAIILGVPLGIMASRHKHLNAYILSFVGVLQTIPSLALLAFLLPFFGIGAKPAIVALTLYALLPIVRNTVTGIEAIPAATIEAADGLGFTPKQRLRIVELPLALPFIIAGIRVATVISMGIATLAAFIGAGGLGDFINRGLALNSTGYLLLGAISAALLALLLDFLIAQIELMLDKQKRFHRVKFTLALSVLALIFIIPLYSAVKQNVFTNDQDTIRIGTKNYTEQYILGEMFAQLIEGNTKLHVERDFNLGTTDILQRAMQAGEIDIYPEYTGTAFLTVLHLPYTRQSAQQIYLQTQAEYLRRYGIWWLRPLGFDNTQSIGVSGSFAAQYHLSKISDLTPIQKILIIGAPTEFVQREDGLPGLISRYQIHFGKIVELEPELIYDALRSGQVNTIVAFSTDGHIPIDKIVLLKDDKNLFPPYYCAPIARMATLEAHPEIQPLMDKLAGMLDDQTMQKLNAEVDLQKLTPAEVAHAFLMSKGLLKS